MRHCLTISKDWPYTRTRTKGGTTFAFHSSEDCPGYSIGISNWRLRKLAPSQTSQSPDASRLANEAYDELKRVLGDSAFAETHKIEAKINARAKRPTGLLPPPGIGPTSEKVLEETKHELAIAMFKDLFSPRVALLSVPLFTLFQREQALFAIENVPWSYATPPLYLEHLATTGFECRSSLGIIAIPPFGSEVWIVRAFSQAEIDLKWDRKAALEEEFPWMTELGQKLSNLNVIPEVMEANRAKMLDQNKRLAFLHQAITSGVRSSIEASEKMIVKRQNDLCLQKLNDEQMLLFLFLIGYSWKKEQKKIFSKRDICWALGLGDQSHPEYVSRAENALIKEFPPIKSLIKSFRAPNAKGEKREKKREISYDAMTNAERRRLRLDDVKDEDSDSEQ